MIKKEEAARLDTEFSVFDGQALLGLDRLGIRAVAQCRVRVVARVSVPRLVVGSFMCRSGRTRGICSSSVLVGSVWRAGWRGAISSRRSAGMAGN